jgi:hypothetical protein
LAIILSTSHSEISWTLPLSTMAYGRGAVAG